MPTKYARQIASAQRLVQKKGVQVTWLKADNTNAADDPAPEFPTEDAPTSFKVWMVFYPLTNERYVTLTLERTTASPSTNTFAIMAGGLPFTPEEGDAVQFPDGTIVHVETMNITQPDLVPIVYELAFK